MPYKDKEYRNAYYRQVLLDKKAQNRDKVKCYCGRVISTEYINDHKRSDIHYKLLKEKRDKSIGIHYVL